MSVAVAVVAKIQESLTANAGLVVQRLLIAAAALIVRVLKMVKEDVVVLQDAVLDAQTVCVHYLKS